MSSCRRNDRLCRMFWPVWELVWVIGDLGEGRRDGKRKGERGKTYVEVLDSYGTGTIVLNNLIFSIESSSTVNVAGSRGLFDSQGIFADVRPPDVVEGAWAKAMYSLTVVGADDDVGEYATALNQKDSIGITTLGLVITGRC